MTDYVLVLSHHPDYAGREWSMSGNDYDTLLIHDGGPKPTRKSLDDRYAQTVYHVEHAAVEAQRRARYQAETDGLYFDAMREDTANLATWRAAVDQIKADLPYPTPPEARP